MLPLLKHPRADADFKKSMLSSPSWAAEQKYDGSRAFIYFENKSVRLVMRSGNIRYALNLPYKRDLEGTILDTEIYDPAGFAATMRALMTEKKQKQANNLQVAVFDIPYYLGKDIRTQTLLERRKYIVEVIDKLCLPNVHITPQVYAEKEAFFLEQTSERGAEGIILKHLHRAYGLDWVKVKAFRETSVLVGRNSGEAVQSYCISVGQTDLGHIKIPDYALKSIRPGKTVVDIQALGLYTLHNAYRFREPSVIRLRPDLTKADLSLEKIVTDMGKAIYK